MDIRIRKVKNRIKKGIAESLIIGFCANALTAVVIWRCENKVVQAAGGLEDSAAAQSDDISLSTKEMPKEKPGDYAMLTRPEGDPDNYLKLTASMEAHMVEEGESLWEIARKVYGDGSRWQDISALNGLRNPGIIFPGQCLMMPDQEYYLQKPGIQKGKGYYMEDAGAFRFQTPERWALGTSGLDIRLSTFAGTDRRARVLWGLEDNEMGEDAWAGNWDEVCADMEQTARMVFGEALEELCFEKYQVESGNEVYAVRCIFTDKNGERQIMSAAYRFGQKNLMEFIGFAPEEFTPDMSRLTLYTAATYEEYEEERHMGFGEKDAEYRGMEIWEYPKLHNPFVLAWEYVNGTAWRLKREPESIEDYIIEWKEPVLPAVLKEALQIEGDIYYSDLLQIETLEAVETAGYDFCSVNGMLYETDWNMIGSGDALVEDISHLGGLYTLRIQIGDITDVSSLERLTVLDELEILTGAQAQEMKIPEKLNSLKMCVLEKAPLQDYVDALDDTVWERTCREQKITTFHRTKTDL